MKKSIKNTITKLAKYQIFLGYTFLIIALILLLVPSIPQLWYQTFPQSTQEEINNIQFTFEDLMSQQNVTSDKKALPQFDPTLSTKDFIIIPKIGVKAPLERGTNYTEVLRHGAWMVNDFPTPSTSKKPVIVASHRFGYIDWSAQTRKEISFYNLPKLRTGDEIQIIWNQRKYIYKIVKSSEGNNITDYNVDLILYTCKLFNSPIRIFKYAQRTN